MEKAKVNTCSYYEQVAEKSLPLIKYYHADLAIHDHSSLCGYTGRFIHLTRDTGTHLIKFIDYSEYPAYGEKVPYLFGHADGVHIIKGHLAYLPYCDSAALVLYGEANAVVEMSADEAKALIQEYVDRGVDAIMNRKAS